ncbi:hypothetical protein CALCODRAFT_499519 [Calocera cornea HHB12733]|uniref:NAD(P)-binding protein n=1 Tax=Calocera cornea HHB12733 TaxID=1353952 RepID=A0A165EEH7_9BASI|nr:hypothetical protein CALCODRAFT_499519 [Calocera cornea HHB12733]
MANSSTHPQRTANPPCTTPQASWPPRRSPSGSPSSPSSSPPHSAPSSSFSTPTLHRATLPSYRLSPASFALIAGSSGGIARWIAREFLLLGYNVIIHGRSAENLQEVKEELEQLGTGKEVQQWVQDAADEAVDWEGVRHEFEGVEISVLVNCVGGTDAPAVLYLISSRCLTSDTPFPPTRSSRST